MNLSAIFMGALLALAASGAGVCKKVDGDRIYASDLAAAAPAFASLNPALEIGIAPLPGIMRILRPGDLVRLAKDNGITLPSLPGEVCFERDGSPARTATAPKGPGPLAVKRGEKVSVRVISGAVTLKFESEAESSGHPGDTVIVRNPENGGDFAARVEDQGKVVVNR
jgi:hypothetical protein